MKVRLLTSLGIAIIGIPLLIFSQYIIYPIALGIVSALAAWELLRIFGMSKNAYVAVPTYIFSAACPFFASDVFVGADRHRDYILILACAAFIYLLFVIFVSVLGRGKIKNRDISAVYMAVIYETVAFTSLALLRYMNNGVYVFALVFVGAWISDTFAFLIGTAIGKHKLIPEVSPNKTIEGSLAGVIFGTAGVMLYGFIVERAWGLDANYLTLACIGVSLAVVGQLGDLWGSYIKREYGVKDFSRILPGHGGIMDRFDSILSASPVLLMICTLFPPFTVV